MIRLFQIEFFKLKYTKFFWILCGLFILLMLSVPQVASKIVGSINDGTEAVFGQDQISIPFFAFEDIWQNIFFILKNFSLFLGFIIVISVSKDYSTGMIKQNVIDGMSRKEVLWSKVSLILVLSFITTLIAAGIILFMGFRYSPVTDMAAILKHVEFVPAYFLHLVAFLLFCMVVTMGIKRSGITIAFLFFYVFVIEPLLVMWMSNHGLAAPAEFLPVNAISNIIRFPYTKYAFMETQTSVGLVDLSILIGYIVGLYALAQHMMCKRDLN